MTDVNFITVNVTITETDVEVYEVKASYINECGKEYTSIITGEIEPWSDVYIPVYKELASLTLYKALVTNFNMIVRVKYPDINDPYDGFLEGEIREFKYIQKSTC